MHTVLEVRALDKTFPVGFLRRRRQVLFGIDLTLGAGESVGLCGPNGSGKSTLLRCLAGVERPSAGTLALFGSTPDDPGARARVGFLPDASPFPAELSARDALQLLASLHGFSAGERARRVERGLATVGLAADANRALGRYSKGMLRRFGLAQAFLADPDLVLLDEPTAGLDATGHAVLEELIADARERGATLVIASHDVADVTLFTERVCVLIDGRIAADGPATELVEAEGRTRLEVEGLERTELVTLEAEVGRLGGRVVASGPATGTLAALYRRLSARAGEKA